MEELCFDKHMRTNSKLGSWTVHGIGQDLIVRLSELDLLFQFDMQQVKVNSKVTSSRGSNVLFGMDSE